MVGDGVNDVPALKAARLAIAQGTGAQMAKSVADVVLVQGDFAAVPPMVAEGRTILRNVQRVARLFVTKSVFAAVMIVAFALAGFDYPFIPRQLSLAATLTIGVPAFFLALAPSAGPWRPDDLVRGIAPLRRARRPGARRRACSWRTSSRSTSSTSRTEAARTVATTTLVVVGLGYVVALEGGRRRSLAARARAADGRGLRGRPGGAGDPRLLRAAAAVGSDAARPRRRARRSRSASFLPLWRRIAERESAAAQRPQTGQGEAPERA